MADGRHDDVDGWHPGAGHSNVSPNSLNVTDTFGGAINLVTPLKNVV
jgi:hypothetical protein